MGSRYLAVTYVWSIQKLLVGTNVRRFKVYLHFLNYIPII